jgi:sporulation protein YlmC with PRC-barrel domain
MARIVVAKQLAGKKIITNDGEDLGKLIDIMISESSGKMEHLMVEPNPDNATARDMHKEDGLIILPYDSVLASSDHVIVDKKNIR